MVEVLEVARPLQCLVLGEVQGQSVYVWLALSVMMMMLYSKASWVVVY